MTDLTFFIHFPISSKTDRRPQCKGLNSIFRTKSVMNATGVKVNHQLSED